MKFMAIKKSFYLLCGLLLLLMGCTTPLNLEKQSINEASRNLNQDVPIWFIYTQDDEENYYGIGSAKLKDLSLTKTAAEDNARSDISRQVETKVQDIIEQYGNESGTEKVSDFVSVFLSAYRHISETKLYGSSVIERYVSKDGRIYILMAYAKDALMEKMREQEELKQAYDRLPEAQKALLEKEDFFSTTFVEVFNDSKNEE